jgi:hypothetical protein
MRADRQSWNRAIASLALAALRKHEDANKIVTDAWPSDARAALIVRGAVSPTSRADFPTIAAVTAFRSLAPSSAALQLFELGLALDLTGRTTIGVPALASLPPQALFVAEGQPAPNTQWTFASTIVGPARKILLMAAVTGELEAATPESASAVIGRVLSDVANRSIDAAAFGTAAADATRPPGLLFNVTPITPAAAGVDAMATDLADLVGAIGAAGIDASGAVFVMGAREAAIAKIKVGPKFDYPILETLGLPPKTVCVFAPAGVASGFQDAPTVETSREASFHLEDTTPAQIVGAGGALAVPTKSAFQSNFVSIRVRGNCAWGAAPGAAQVVSGINW